MEKYFLYLGINTLFPAYIDPGTGSMLLQVIISCILGIGFSFRRLIANACLWVKNKVFKNRMK